MTGSASPPPAADAYFGSPTTNRNLILVFAVLCLVHVAMKIWWGIDIVAMKQVGDEGAYIDSAKALSNLARDLLRFSPPDTAELSRNVIGNGWFMPGMAILLAPLYLAFPGAEITLVRIYLALVSFLMWLWAVNSARTHLGNRYALALMIFPALVPLWILFSFSAWGDLYAGLLLVVLMCHVSTLLICFQRPVSIRVSQGVVIGALAAGCLYLRSSTLPLMPLLLLILLLGAALFSGIREWRRPLMCISAAALSFICLLLPWSISASKTLGARILTTTTVPISLGVAFGNQDELCFGSCGKGNIWFNSVRYSKTLASVTGVDEVSVQKDMSRYATRGVTPATYSAKVIENFGRYAFSPGSFRNRFFPDKKGEGGAGYAAKRELLFNATVYPYYLFMLFMVLAWVTVKTRTVPDQVNSILIKCFSACLLLQPFFHIGSGRYWTVFAPIFALSLGLLLTPPVMAVPASTCTSKTRLQLRALSFVQAAFVVAIAAIVATLFLFARG